jgi:acetylornithine deacetylase/succinyl-diaminopimelate desuccinylase-like protein
MKRQHQISVVMSIVAAVSLTDATAQNPVEAARVYVESHRAEIVAELREFVAIPNVASDELNIRRNAEALASMMERRGIATRVLETGGPPVVYGEIGDPSLPTVLFYCHYDGQPANPAEWEQDNPWTPILRTESMEAGGQILADWPEPGGVVNSDWRVYARGASDDKAPIIALLHMLDAWREADISPPNRVKFLFEGEEEAGSPHLGELVRQNRGLFAADLVVMADGPIHPSRSPTADFGLRGFAGATLTMYGPIVALHSGHYGNWAPNPALRLAQLLATMKGPNGEILVEDWEDDVVQFGPEERAALDTYPHDDETRRLQLQLGSVEGTGETRLERVSRPSLNVQGFQSLFVGAMSRNAVPDVAIAELDLRLVSGNDPARQVEKLVRHIERQGYTVVREEPDSATRVNTPRLIRVEGGSGYPAGRTPLSSPAAQGLMVALERVGLGEPVISPTMGGSGPAWVYTEILGAPFVVVPTVNHDNNQHAKNENVRLGHVFRAVEILAATASAMVRAVP